MSAQTQMVVMLAAAVLQPDPENPRKPLDSEELRLELHLLGQDMKRRGVLVPLLVRKSGEVYPVADGHRRLAAALLAGIERLPCIVLGPDVPEAQVREISLVTQLHSQALTPYEVYCGCKSWLALHPGATAKQLADAINRTEAYVSKLLSLDRCIQPVKDAAAEGKIGLSDWYALSKAPDAQQEALLTAKLNGASRDELESKSRKARNGSKPVVRMSRVKCLLPSGVCVTLAGDGEGLTLDEVIEALQDLLKEAKRANDQGLDSKTFSAVMRDKAKAGG